MALRRLLRQTARPFCKRPEGDTLLGMPFWTLAARRLSPVLLVIGILLESSSAFSFVVYTSDKNGLPLRWFQDVVRYQVSSAEPEEIHREVLADVVQRSMAVWGNTAPCALPRLSYAGTNEAEEGGYKTSDNVNLVVMVGDRDAWLGKGLARNVVAMTTLTYQRSTGALVDADVELNDWNFFFTATTPPPEQGMDLMNTLVHEAGHFLGLDHSEDPRATMFWKAPSGESSKRDLDRDDIEGICWLYSESASEAGGLDSVQSPGTAPGPQPTCSAGMSGHPTLAWPLMLLLLAGLWGRRRRA